MTTAGLGRKDKLDLYNSPSLWMSNEEQSHDQARAEAGELPEEERLMWANTVQIQNYQEERGVRINLSTQSN